MQHTCNIPKRDEALQQQQRTPPPRRLAASRHLHSSPPMPVEMSVPGKIAQAERLQTDKNLGREEISEVGEVALSNEHRKHFEAMNLRCARLAQKLTCQRPAIHIAPHLVLSNCGFLPGLKLAGGHACRSRLRAKWHTNAGQTRPFFTKATPDRQGPQTWPCSPTSHH